MEHKHRGVERKTGSLRSHPIRRKHMDKKVQDWHNKSLTKKQVNFWQGNKPKTVTETVDKRAVLCTVDEAGYINIDLDKSKKTGIKIKFTRVEGQTKRTVGLVIDRKG